MLTAVVTRKLNGHETVISCVIVPKDLNGIDDVEHYLNYVAEEHIQEFKNTFVEFRNAQWEVIIIKPIH